MNNENNELNNKTNELNIYDVAIRMVPGANQYERVKISILADQVKEYIESQAEVEMFSSADIYYVVNAIVSEVLDIAIDWEGSTEYLRTAIMEPIERAYSAAVKTLLEEMGLDELDQ